MNPKEPSFLKGLDYSVVQQCMHCGLCLPTCPTYDATKLERHSPRGRISLMRAIADDRLEPSRAFGEEMYFCLGCLACMTACPAGVNYASLFEHARAEVERTGVLDNPVRTAIRSTSITWLFEDLNRLKLLGRGIRLYQELGIQTLIRRSGVMKVLPDRLKELEAMTPAVQHRYTEDLVDEVTPARGTRRFRVAVLTGCAQDLIFSDVNKDTVEVLAYNGCEVYTPSEQSCCGSLHAHNGEYGQAQAMARRQLDQFPPEQFDAIITNAAGCGTHLKNFSELLHGDTRYAERAKLWDRKVKDIHEWLVEINFEPPQDLGLPPIAVTYHEACHLCHGQKIISQPRKILRSIPNVRLIELSESTWCCGSAGIYNVIQPEMAGQLLKRKIDKIKSSTAKLVAMGNPGCLLHIRNGLRSAGIPVEAVHPVSLLAAAYRGNSARA